MGYTDTCEDARGEVGMDHFLGRGRREDAQRGRTRARRFALLLAALGCLVPFGAAIAARLTAGAGHTCVIADAGETYCWGSNVYGQLGDGTQTDRDGPVRATALSVQATAIVAGWNHTCVITPAGGAQCWGLNQFGQLGDGSTTETDVAVDVVGLSSGVQAIAGGRRHGCALLQSGSMQCWGANDYGQLGTGDTAASLVPVTVSDLGNSVIGIAAGEYSTCAILSGGAAKCWGRNDAGQLGNGTRANTLVPTPVTGLAGGVAEVSIHSYGACARLQTGAVKCWGYYLGNGDPDIDSDIPVDVLSVNEASSVQVGYLHRCVRMTSGAVACWGEGRSGEIGDGALVDRWAPTPVAQLAGAVEVVAGLSHSCALIGSGEVRCWGNGSSGQLGHGRPAKRSVPVDVRVQGGEPIVRMALGSYHACASTASGNMQCWGDNSSGQLGDGTTVSHSVPALVAGALAHDEVSAGRSFTCSMATKAAQQHGAYCWGTGSRGELGNGGFGMSTEPTAVTNSANMVALTSRDASTCAIVSAGHAMCWGANGYGQLGYAGGNDVLVPDVPNNLSGLVDVSMGNTHACAIQSPGTVHCWGSNSRGELGDGTHTSSLLPVAVVGLGAPAISVSAGNGQTCAVLDGGAVKCWGRADDGGELAQPTLVPGLDTGVRRISLGLYHACAVRMDGAARCWGSNYSGELGDGSFVARATPVEPRGLDHGVTQVVASEGSSCAVMQDGSARCWGSNVSGQLGNGEQGYAPVPERVSGTPLSGVIFRNGLE